MQHTADNDVEISEPLGEVQIEYEIKDFFSQPTQLRSPSFHFSGTSLCLYVARNGLKSFNAGWIGVFLRNCTPVRPVNLTVSCSIKTIGSVERTQPMPLIEKNKWWGIHKYVSRSDLEKRKLELVTFNVFTIICTIKHRNRIDVRNSSFGMLMNASACWEKILKDKVRTDVVLKVGEREFPAHRAVLESRSPVFSAMFAHDMESRTGVVNIQDISPDAFQIVLSYVYSGNVSEISFDEVFDVYLAADKYYFNDLKGFCRAFMGSNLCTERVCDVIKFADVHGELKLGSEAREYFYDNVKEVLQTDVWKKFSEKNHTLSMDLVTTVLMDYI